jgi:hypothetical protein
MKEVVAMARFKTEFSPATCCSSRGQMLMILERPQEALQALRAALDRDPDHPQAAHAIHAVEEWLAPPPSDSAKEAEIDQVDTDNRLS